MSFYDAMKDAVSLAQKADNIELYRQLLDLSAQALEMQAEIAKLKEENSTLKKSKDLDAEIEYHIDPFVTKKTDTVTIKYCAACWADKRKLVALQLISKDIYRCNLCKAKIQDLTNYHNERQNDV